MKLEKRGDLPGEGQQTPPEEKAPVDQKKRETSVIIYTLVLFVVALALILLSYKIQQRANTTLSDITEQHGAVTAQALRNIEELQKKNLELTDELAAARKELEDAQESLAALETGRADLERERDALNAQIKELNLRAEDLEKSARAASTLTRLVTTEDEAEREALLRELTTLSQYLDADGAEIYNAFLESLMNQPPEETQAPETPENGDKTEE